MGAAPSRETTEHVLSELPFYGQRQQIVLIPLLKKFFPSPDCPLFLQLYEARCDPAVRYYYYANDGVSETDSKSTLPVSPTVYAADENVGNVGSPLYLAKVIGSAPVYCPPADVFPPVPFTREAMYDVYITNGGEKMVYETDEEMLRAYRADPTSVRPLPCAVAFLYYRPTSAVSSTPVASGGTAGGERDDAAEEPGTATTAGGTHVFPEDCTKVLGFYVKATGFIGDVHGLGGSCPRRLPDYEMQMFLTRSAGDHHRTHVLLAAVYTYAEQWQRACLHCVPCDLKAKELTPASTPGCHNTENDLGDVYYYYKPLSQLHDMLVEASRTASHHHLARTKTVEEGERHRGALEWGEKVRFWAPPPLLALVMRSRRANVPLLCFLREVRTCARSFFLFYIKYSLEHQASRREGKGEGVDGAGSDGDQRTEGLCPIASLDSGSGDNHVFTLPPLESTQMWLQEVNRVSDSLTEDNDVRASADTETMLNFYMMGLHVRALAEFAVSCLLHHINPLDVFRLSAGTDQAAAAAAAAFATDGKRESGTTEEAPAADAVGGNAFFFAPSTAAAMLVANPILAQAVSLVRLPDEDMLVQPWPPTTNGDEAGGRATSSTAASAGAARSSDSQLLSLWRYRHPNFHLFWVVGPDVVKRRSATAAFLHWYKTERAPVVWGYNPDERVHGLAAGGNEAATATGGTSSQGFSSSCLESYMSTETLNGREEKLLCCNTVLSLVALDAGASPEARVLRVCRLPLEELLLGELRNASKLAREAGPGDSHWVRQTETTGGDGCVTKYKSCVLHASEPANGGCTAMISSHGVELPVVPPEADGFIGDGTSCLWRINLVDGVYRIITVTPQFLKPIRKKHLKKKRLPPKEIIRHSTAADVFFPVAPSSPVTVSPTLVRSTATPSSQNDDKDSRKKTPVRDSVDEAPGSSQGPVSPGSAPFGDAAAVSGSTTTHAVAALAAPTTRVKRKVPKTGDVASEPPAFACIPTAAPSKEENEAVSSVGANTVNVAACAGAAVGAARVEYTKGERMTPTEKKHSNRAEAAWNESPVTAAQETAVYYVKQCETSPSSHPAGSGAPRAKVVRPAAAPAATSAIPEIPRGVGAGDAVLGSSAAGVGVPILTTADAKTPRAERPQKVSSTPQLQQPPVSPGGPRSKSKIVNSGTDGRHRAPSTVNSFCGASRPARAPCYPPEYSSHPPPPSYDAYPLLPLPTPPALRGPHDRYERGHGDDYGAPLPAAPPCAGTQTSPRATLNCGGHYDGPDGFQRHAGDGGGYNNRDSNPPGHYNLSRGDGAAGAVGSGKQIGDGGYSDSQYVYAPHPQQQKARPTSLHQQQHYVGAMKNKGREDGVPLVEPYLLFPKYEGSSYVASPSPVAVAVGAPVTSPGSEINPHRMATCCEHGTTSSFERCAGSGADAAVPQGTPVDKKPIGSPTGRVASLQRSGTPSVCSAGAKPPVSPSARHPIPFHTTVVPPPLSHQGSAIYSPRVSHDLEGCHHTSGSSAGVPLQFQPDELNSIATSDSNPLIANGLHWNHARYASSPYHAGTARMEDVEVTCSDGSSTIGGAVNVLVRVRHHHHHYHHHHHHTHSRTESYLSDTNTDAASAHYHPLHDSGHYMNSSASVASGGGGSGIGAASPTGPQICFSLGSVGSSSIAFHGACCVGTDSACEISSATGCDHRHVPFAGEDHQHQHRHDALGAVASSARSGDTANTARIVYQRTGAYRWDWRTVSLDMGDEV
ncbi:hypothetical protein JKF63_03879 [Porcisia hertigi]|uniref:Uncharacterized protein n=1 Tax=Porcisia hertigi TaxID=2761500 RepID=A0A836L458_9TRYP|nr:hypothetical protein JKF63_03879 [Porcisia hertigi]